MSCVHASVHDLHHCTKLQLSTNCRFGVMTQTRHTFPEFQSEKSVRTGICTIVRAIRNQTRCSNDLCIYNCNKYRTQMLAVLAV